MEDFAGPEPELIRKQRLAHDRPSERSIDRANTMGFYRSLCATALENKRNNKFEYLTYPDGVIPETDKGRGFLQWILPSAFATEETPSPPRGYRREACAMLKNSEVASVFENDIVMKKKLELIEAELTKLKTEITQKLRQKFPTCTPDFIPIPVVYGKYQNRSYMDKAELESKGVSSVLPNPVNSIVTDRAVISPEPYNSTFKQYLIEEYDRRGLNAEFVDTYDITHVRKGNLHCATNTVHVCRPRTN